MSEFGRPKECINGCGSQIYFDKYSSVGHPTAEKWLPLEYKEGMRTDTIHNCPKKGQGQNGLVTAITTNAAAATTTSNASLSFAESLDQVLQDYIRLKQLKWLS